MLTIIIVSHNSYSTLIECMPDFLRDPEYPVIIMDNASTDGTPQKIRSSFPKVECISLDSNIGYGRAANIGLSRISSQYALLLNPDVQVNNTLISQLLDKVLKNKDYAAIFAPSTIKLQENSSLELIEKKCVLGAALLFDTEQMASVGYFDENIFLFYEEVDLCKRVRDLGKKIVLYPHIYFPHIKGTSTSPSLAIDYLKQWHVAWSSMYFFRKHRMTQGKRSAWRMILQYLFKAVFTVTSRKRRKYIARFQGATAFIFGKQAFDSSGKARASPP
jgi:N-acetylglucosaminyl-diphospho-decaprenol L-rhamnosyltransferase